LISRLQNRAGQDGPAVPLKHSREKTIDRALPAGSRPPAGKRQRPALRTRPRKILVLDVGASNVKMLATGQTEVRKVRSGRKLTAQKMVNEVLAATKEWEFEAVSIGYPGTVGEHGPRLDPKALGPGWVGFDFVAAFDRPVKVINDAVMQALGSYEGGRMLFLGLGTNLGSALIADRVIFPLELGSLPYKVGHNMNDALNKRGRKELGQTGGRRL